MRWAVAWTNMAARGVTLRNTVALTVFSEVVCDRAHAAPALIRLGVRNVVGVRGRHSIATIAALTSCPVRRLLPAVPRLMS
jgi:hypothetical protein